MTKYSSQPHSISCLKVSSCYSEDPFFSLFSRYTETLNHKKKSINKGSQ